MLPEVKGKGYFNKCHGLRERDYESRGNAGPTECLASTQIQNFPEYLKIDPKCQIFIRSLAPNGFNDLGWMWEVERMKEMLITCFKQVVLDRLSHFYSYGFNSLHEQFLFKFFKGFSV